MSSLVVWRVCGEEKKAEEWKKLEHVVFISSPMSGKPVKVMMLLCDFEELFLSLQHWVIKMGGGEFLLHLPISALCVQCSLFPNLSHRAFIWGLGDLYLTFFQSHIAESLDKTLSYSHLDGSV